VARTAADIEGSDRIHWPHLEEAIVGRLLDQRSESTAEANPGGETRH